jgi:DNA-binding transcriptional LysR family regulator
VLIVHPNHPLASRESVPMKALGGERFISFEPDLPTRKMIDRHLRAHSVEPTHVMEFDNIETVKRAVEVESGVSIVPQNTVRQEIAGGVLKMLRLEGTRLSRPLGVIYRRNRPCSPAQAEFMAALKAGAEQAAKDGQ